MTTASSGTREHRKVTTQSAYASVPSREHSAQSMVSTSPMRRTLRMGCDSETPSSGLGQDLDRRTRVAPTAHHVLDTLLQDRLVLDGEVAADGEVVEGGRPLRRGDVEAG